MNKLTGRVAGTTAAAAALPFAGQYLTGEVNAVASQIISETPIEEFYNVEQSVS